MDSLILILLFIVLNWGFYVLYTPFSRFFKIATWGFLFFSISSFILTHLEQALWNGFCLSGSAMILLYFTRFRFLSLPGTVLLCGSFWNLSPLKGSLENTVLLAFLLGIHGLTLLGIRKIRSLEKNAS